MNTVNAPETRLRHILDNIDGITEATKHRTPDEIANDYLTRHALERAVEIISEAAKMLPQELRDQEPDVPWKEIIGIGNVLRHEYYRIRDDRMLNVLRVHLPRLRPAVVRLLDTLEGKR